MRADAPTPKNHRKIVRRNAISDAGYEAFMQDLPQFGEPYITDIGDIVIPRIQPRSAIEPTEKSEEKGKRQI